MIHPDDGRHGGGTRRPAQWVDAGFAALPRFTCDCDLELQRRNGPRFLVGLARHMGRLAIAFTHCGDSSPCGKSEASGSNVNAFLRGADGPLLVFTSGFLFGCGVHARHFRRPGHGRDVRFLLGLFLG